MPVERDSSGLIPVSENAIESQIKYGAKGYRYQDIINKKVTLVSEAWVNYGEIKITGDSIFIDMKNNTLFAVGRKDTSGTIQGKPVYKEGSQEIAADDFLYNFKTKKAVASNIVTKQDQGTLRSQKTKLLEDGTSNIFRSTYSTCDLDTPHFYLRLPRARVYPKEKTVFGPAYMVLEGVPLPLFLPFGYIPVQTKTSASGIQIPRIGQEATRGYSLTDGGYYFAINDYFDLNITGNIYTNGTWMANATSNYKKLYKYSGNFSFSYANNVSGHKGWTDYDESSNYRLGWTFNQDAKASPGSRFSANVNMSSSGFDKNNSYNVTEHVTTTRQSSISYSKTWDGTPFNFSASMNHSQDVRQKTVSLNLPKANFNMNRIYPFKRKAMVGTPKWFEEIQFSYTAALDNRIVGLKDSLLFTNEVWNKMNNGFQHSAPLSLQIKPFNNFSITPSVTYNGVLYNSMLDYRYDEESGTVITDTIDGLSYGHAINTNLSVSFNPQVYGTYEFTNPDSRVQAIRHVIKPSVTFSYNPAIPGLSSDMYREVQYDTLGHTREYSIYNNKIFGTPSVSKRSGSVSFSLVNLIEAKVFDRNDTTGKPKKVKILDNFGITTSYDIFRDSMRWAPISMQGRTLLANNINISASANFSLYGYDSRGAAINTYNFKQNGNLLRLTQVNGSVDLNISDLFKGKKDANESASQTPNALTGGKQTTTAATNTDLSQSNKGAGIRDEYGYPVFNVPWTMNMSYSMTYSKNGISSNLAHSMTLSGSASITKKTAVTYNTGYDFTQKEITMTQIGISRDLHCWQMNFNWIPNGTMKSWNFTIRVKASVLGDLKYERRKDFHDTY
ncbi:MAG TPA: putative LPS assembly protein LptD [Bacteroidales bacterium]|nr:putative LPS assembly protein LptD [Bacteroidales bacterium]